MAISDIRQGVVSDQLDPVSVSRWATLDPSLSPAMRQAYDLGARQVDTKWFSGNPDMQARAAALQALRARGIDPVAAAPGWFYRGNRVGWIGTAVPLMLGAMTGAGGGLVGGAVGGATAGAVNAAANDQPVLKGAARGAAGGAAASGLAPYVSNAAGGGYAGAAAGGAARGAMQGYASGARGSDLWKSAAIGGTMGAAGMYGNDAAKAMAARGIDPRLAGALSRAAVGGVGGALTGQGVGYGAIGGLGGWAGSQSDNPVLSGLLSGGVRGLASGYRSGDIGQGFQQGLLSGGVSGLGNMAGQQFGQWARPIPQFAYRQLMQRG